MVDGDDTYDAAVAPRAGRPAGRRQPRHGGRQADRDPRGRVSRRPPARQPRADRPGRAGCSARRSTTCCRATACSRAGSSRASRRSSREFEIETELTVHAMQMRMADRRDRHQLQGAPAGLDQQAAHVPRRLADPADDHEPHAQRAAAAVLLADRPRCSRWSRSRSAIPVRARVPRHRLGAAGSRPRSCAAASAWSRCVCIATGLILDLVAHVRREAKRLVYLQHAAPARPARPPPGQRGGPRRDRLSDLASGDPSTATAVSGSSPSICHRT